jgi:hypothetical protein
VENPLHLSIAVCELIGNILLKNSDDTDDMQFMANNTKNKPGEGWYSSKEAKSILKISDCELMHRREAGKLIFVKKGNAFFYKLVKPQC